MIRPSMTRENIRRTIHTRKRVRNRRRFLTVGTHPPISPSTVRGCPTPSAAHSAALVLHGGCRRARAFSDAPRRVRRRRGARRWRRVVLPAVPENLGRRLRYRRAGSHVPLGPRVLPIMRLHAQPRRRARAVELARGVPRVPRRRHRRRHDPTLRAPGIARGALGRQTPSSSSRPAPHPRRAHRRRRRRARGRPRRRAKSRLQSPRR